MSRFSLSLKSHLVLHQHNMSNLNFQLLMCQPSRFLTNTFFSIHFCETGWIRDIISIVFIRISFIRDASSHVYQKTFHHHLSFQSIDVLCSSLSCLFYRIIYLPFKPIYVYMLFVIWSRSIYTHLRVLRCKIFYRIILLHLC